MLNAVSAQIPEITQEKEKCSERIQVVRLHQAALESSKPMKCIPNTFCRLSTVMVVLAVCGFPQVVIAQNVSAPQAAAPQQGPTKEPQAPIEPLVAAPEKASRVETDSLALVLGPGDEVEVNVYGAPDLSAHSRVSADGNISMPLIGYVRIGGLSDSEAEGAIEAKLRHDNVLNDPQVSVYVKDYGSSGISVAGEVAKPGFYSALGPHRLFDVLQEAGGTTDKAANQVVISHRGQEDATTLSISKNPAEMAASNVDLKPGDTVVVPKAGIVYVLGEVTRPGGYVLNATGGVTVLQVVAVAGGTTHVASAGKTRLLHRTGSGFQEQQINLKKLLRGKAHDVSVQNDDILFVPSSAFKEALNAGTLLATASTAAIYRVPF
jgi:polysaccharide export outer membrane protein